MSTSTINLDEREREFIVVSGASMHIVSKMSLTPEELETVEVSRFLTSVITANGSIDTTEEAIACVNDLDMFVTIQLFEDTPACATSWKLGEDNVSSYEWKKVKHRIFFRMARLYFADNFVPIVMPGRSKKIHFTSSAELTERIKEMTPDEQETTLASRNQLQDLPEGLEEYSQKTWWNTNHHLRDLPGPLHSDPLPDKSTKRKAPPLPPDRFIRILCQSKHQRRKQIMRFLFPKTQIVK